jgi:hypothetical protein
MAGAYGEPIYQAYVDAVKSRQQADLQKQELQLNQMKMGMEYLNLQQSLQERQITSQVWQQMNGGQGGADGTAGGSGPNHNPTTGDDPTLKQAAVYDTLAAKLGGVNPKISIDYANKASEIRNRYYTQQKDKLQIAKAQTEQVANVFGSITDQGGYTEALAQLQDQGIDVTKFGLSGIYSTDAPKLESIAKQSMTYAQKLTAAHQSATEQQAGLTLQERIRHDQATEGTAAAHLALSEQSNQLQASWKRFDMEYKSREEARAQAGFQRTTDEAIGKAKHYAQTPNPKTDKPYIDSLMASDQRFKDLTTQQKQMASAEINLTARNALGEMVTKPGDTPSADDFMSAAQKAADGVAKRITTKSGGFFGMTKTAQIAPKQPDTTGTKANPSKGAVLPKTVSSQAEVSALAVGAQFTLNGKIYKKTSATEVEEVK